MAKITKQLKDAVSPLTATQMQQVVGYARTLHQHSAERKSPVPKRTSKRSQSTPLEGTCIGKLILKLEASGELGLPADFASQIDHYAYGTKKRSS
jgi:hypothetical protein